MKKLHVLTFFFTLLLLSGCSQEKVMDTELIRLQNKVKDIEVALKQREDESLRVNQKLTEMEETMTKQNEQINQLISASQDIQFEEKHPVIIQDVKLTSEKMDPNSRVWGPYNLNVTLYNGTTRVIQDNISAIILEEDPNNSSQAPKVKQMVQKFELGPKESKIVSLIDLPINDPTKRLNVILKLLENTPSPDNEGVIGKATWVVVPTIIFPPTKQ